MMKFDKPVIVKSKFTLYGTASREKIADAADLPEIREFIRSDRNLTEKETKNLCEYLSDDDFIGELNKVISVTKSGDTLHFTLRYNYYKEVENSNEITSCPSHKEIISNLDSGMIKLNTSTFECSVKLSDYL